MYVLGPCWWLSGQRARLLLSIRVRIPLKPTVFSVKMLVRDWPIFKRKHLYVRFGREPWFCGYERRLTIKRFWVWIPSHDAGLYHLKDQNNVINKFYHSIIITLYWNKDLWLDVPSRVTTFNRSECFISAQWSLYDLFMTSAPGPWFFTVDYLQHNFGKKRLVIETPNEILDEQIGSSVQFGNKSFFVLLKNLQITVITLESV